MEQKPHSELARRVLADQKGHRQISLTLAQEVLDLEEQLEAAREEVLFLCSDEDDIRKGLRGQVEAADEFKAAMVRANQRQVDEITSLREQLETMEWFLRHRTADEGMTQWEVYEQIDWSKHPEFASNPASEPEAS